MIDLAHSPISALLQPEIEELVEQRRFGELRAVLTDLTPPDVADILRALKPEHHAVAFRVLHKQFAADVFEHLPTEDQEALIQRMGQAEVAAVLNEMDPDDRTALLEEFPGAVTQRLIAGLSPEERAVATRLLGYPEDSIGRLMTPDYAAIRKDWTIREVFDHLRRVGQDKETLNTLYVVDERHRMVDDILLRQCVLAAPDARVADLMDGQYASLSATDDQETAISVFEKYDRSSLPVMDSDGTLVGIVTFDDVMDVAKEEVTEDIQKLGGMEALETPYPAAGLFEMLRKRSGWLVLLFLGQFVAIAVIERFETALKSATMLAFFQLLIVSSGGNSGSQAATLVIRSLALQELQLRDWWRVLRREMLQGLSLGLMLGLMGFLRIELWHVFGWEHYVDHLPLAITIGVSLLGVVMVGVLAGSMLPFLLHRLGFDPAASSTPFVATIVDVAGMLIYLTTATLILGLALP